jgi:hypothetical protein
MKSIVTIIAALGMANWLAWGIGAIFLGGDALAGKEENGRYFLRSHGRYTEVSRRAFTYSRIHGYTAWAGFGVAALVAVSHAMKKDTKHESHAA